MTSPRNAYDGPEMSGSNKDRVMTATPGQEDSAVSPAVAMDTPLIADPMRLPSVPRAVEKALEDVTGRTDLSVTQFLIVLWDQGYEVRLIDGADHG